MPAGRKKQPGLLLLRSPANGAAFRYVILAKKPLNHGRLLSRKDIEGIGTRVQEGAEHLDKWQIRHRRVFMAMAIENHRSRLNLGAQFPQEPGLADARVAPDEHEARPPRFGLVERLLEEG